MLTPGMQKTEDEHRRDLCEVGRWIHQREYIAASDGNLSVRLDSARLLTSPTGMSKGMMQPDDLVIVDSAGKKLLGRRDASSEIAMHLLIYQRRPDVHAVVHAHPPVATGYAAAGLPLNQALISEVVLALGCVPLASYGTPGTPELSDALAPLVGRYDAILMANHGVVTCGDDLLRAYFRMETVEHFARISLTSHLLGRQTLLSREDVEKLGEARARYFGSVGGPAAPLSDVCPITADAVTPSQPGGRVQGSRPMGADGGPVPSPPGEDSRGGAGRFWVNRAELEALIDEAVKSGKVR